MIYEFAQFSAKLFAAGKLAERIAFHVRDTEGAGTMLGSWTTDVGPLRQLLVLRGFPDAQMADRSRTMLCTNPFGAADLIDAMTLDSYAPFPFLPPVAPGAYGGVYEFRTYLLRTGGLAPTIEGWRQAMPERARVSPLTIAMHALGGAPRILHIWPYASPDVRVAIRKDIYAAGIWPPPGGPEQIAEGSSWLAYPTASSPLH
jgi:hypothetical protein